MSQYVVARPDILSQNPLTTNQHPVQDASESASFGTDLKFKNSMNKYICFLHPIEHWRITLSRINYISAPVAEPPFSRSATE